MSSVKQHTGCRRLGYNRLSGAIPLLKNSAPMTVEVPYTKVSGTISSSVVSSQKLKSFDGSFSQLSGTLSSFPDTTFTLVFRCDGTSVSGSIPEFVIELSEL